MSGRKGTAAQTTVRSMQIATLRAQGMQWAAIAKTVGLAESNVRRDYADYMAVIGEFTDPATLLPEILAQVDYTIEASLDLFRKTKARNKNAAVASLKAAMRGLALRAQILDRADVLVPGSHAEEKAFFIEFARTGIDLMSRVQAGEVEPGDVMERFGEAMDFIRTGSRMTDDDVAKAWPPGPRSP